MGSFIGMLHYDLVGMSELNDTFYSHNGFRQDTYR